jgi:hypothetical protein
VHFNQAHLRGDLLAFVVWAAWVELSSRRVLLVTLLFGPPVISLALLFACPDLEQYRGLSALDCALPLELILMRGLSGKPALRAAGVLALALFVAKCAYELGTGRALFAPDLGAGVSLIPLAHVLGALVGLAAFALFAPRADSPLDATRLDSSG